MGCSASNTLGLPHLKIDEVKISQWEKQLNFNECQAETMIECIESNQETEDYITIKSFWEILYFFKFPSSSFPLNTGRASSMYKTIKQDDKIDARKLKALIILLTKDQLKTKALLFHDVINNKVIELKGEQVETFLEIISTIAINLVWMALGKKPDQISMEKLSEIEKKLVDAQKDFIFATKNLLLLQKDVISKRAFITRLLKYPLLFTPAGIRTMINQRYKENVFLYSSPVQQIHHKNTADTVFHDWEKFPDSINIERHDVENSYSKLNVAHTDSVRFTDSLCLDDSRFEKSFENLNSSKEKNDESSIEKENVHEVQVERARSILLRRYLTAPRSRRGTRVGKSPAEIVDAEVLKEKIKLLESENNQLKAKATIFHEESLKALKDLENVEKYGSPFPRKSPKKKEDKTQEFKLKLSEIESKIEDLAAQNEKHMSLNAVRLSIIIYKSRLRSAFGKWKIKPIRLPSVLSSPFKVETDDLTKNTITATTIVTKEMVQEIKCLVTKIVRKKRKVK
ncbi:unnamed protein product [Blepharisma stoltei]|uniref:Uncharacterized protein n=1 Tax=Blepharisma stoltei TaxID=1481888 RepID=A0AAU9J0M9_9CILI|nr:unnamed protein product [Blepharisma stoltei]